MNFKFKDTIPLDSRPLKGYVVFDLETTIKSYMKRKASVFHADNWVVASGSIAKGTHGPSGDTGLYHGSNRMGHRGWLANLLRTHWPKMLVGFNIKFDIMWSIVSAEDYAVYQEWIAQGGQLWDTQLAEYLLDGMVQESHMLSLDEVAPRYGGTVKIDEVKAMWAAGIDTPDIPQDLLMDYLMGRTVDGTFEQGDIHNTELIFLGQLKASQTRGQLKSIQLNNGALAATVEMERNGLYVNVQKGREQARILKDTADKLRASLSNYLPEGLPFEFNWRSRKQLSAFIFGGDVPFKARIHLQDPDTEAYLYAQKDVEHLVLEDGSTMSEEWHDHLQHTEWSRTGIPEGKDVVLYGSGKKKGMPKTKKVKVNDLDKPKLRWETFTYRFHGVTTPKKQWEGAEKGYYSTSSDVIEELAATTDIPFLQDFGNLAAITKDLGTYYIVEEFDEEGELVKAKGMLTLVQLDDNIVHHKLNMTSTVTARFSHSDPNSGNLPRGDDNSKKGGHTSLVKEMFESRWQADGHISSSDFKSLEVYCQAQLTKDRQLVADLRAGLDMHCARLSTVEGKPYDEVLLLAKGDKNRGIAADPEWDEKRTHIKVFSFQRAYGSGAANIAATLKVDVDLVKDWIKADDERYPGVVAWQEAVAAAVGRNAKPTGKWATHPDTKHQVNLNRSFYKTFDGKRYTFQEQCSPKFLAEKGIMQSFSPTEMKNYPVQGLGGEWMKAAMWMALRAFYWFRNFGGLALLINTVHDALYKDSHKSVTRVSSQLMHAAMLAASDFMEFWFETPVQVPVPSDTTFGTSMATEGNFDDNAEFETGANDFRIWMRKTFMGGYTPSFN